MTAHVVVTGGAGFIGSHLCTRLCADGHRVTCFDNLDDFYDPAMKQDNLALLQQNPVTANRLVFYQGDIRDLDTLHQFFQAEPIDVIIHLAARAGVRPSIEQTLLYGDINVQGTLNLLECCRNHHVQDFVFGSSSSVYGDGSSQRDYTYVDDIVDGIVRAWHWLQQGDSDHGICEIFNLGGSHPVLLRDLIHLLEAALGYQANLDWQPMQPGDVPITCADVKKSQTILGFQPQVDIETGLQRFATWFLPRVSSTAP